MCNVKPRAAQSSKSREAREELERREKEYAAKRQKREDKAHAEMATEINNLRKEQQKRREEKESWTKGWDEQKVKTEPKKEEKKGPSDHFRNIPENEFYKFEQMVLEKLLQAANA